MINFLFNPPPPHPEENRILQKFYHTFMYILDPPFWKILSLLVQKSCPQLPPPHLRPACSLHFDGKKHQFNNIHVYHAHT